MTARQLVRSSQSDHPDHRHFYPRTCPSLVVDRPPTSIQLGPTVSALWITRVQRSRESIIHTPLRIRIGQLTLIAVNVLCNATLTKSSRLMLSEIAYIDVIKRRTHVIGIEKNTCPHCRKPVIVVLWISLYKNSIDRR